MADDPIDRIAVAVVALTATAVLEVAGPELTILGWRALVVIGESAEPVRLGVLAERLSLSAPSASKLVRRLERHHLVRLMPDLHDRRGLRVAFTPAGRRIRTTVMERRREALRSAVIGSGPDEDLDAALALVAERLERGTASMANGDQRRAAGA